METTIHMGGMAQTGLCLPSKIVKDHYGFQR